MMTTYFLSYARLDERIALRVADDLIAAGVSVWVDQYDIRPSQHWDQAVETAVRGCGGLIVILSPRSAESPNVADEVSVAIEGGKTLIPILIESCVLPLRMTRMQYIDAVKNYDGALRRCLATIRARDANVGSVSPDAIPDPGEAPPRLSAEVLREAERRLPGFMGPIAGMLVRQAALAANEAELYETSAKAIPNPLDRKSFLDWIDVRRLKGQVVTPRATRIPEGPPARSSIAAEEIKTIAGALARHLGPIAEQLVGREQRTAVSRRELCHAVAQRIPGEKERTDFLRETKAE